MVYCFTLPEFDSYIIPQNEIYINNFRLLDVDNRGALPINTFIRIPLWPSGQHA